MIILVPFSEADFGDLISWIDSEELLVTIAGTDLCYPLTREQLQNYLALPNSNSFTIVDSNLNKKMGHAEIILSGANRYKIDKLIIGNKANRGKGIGEKVVNTLLNYAFEKLHAEVVELNVFDWNFPGIQCYKKCGFVMNENKKATFQVGNENWTALNMVLTKESRRSK